MPIYFDFNNCKTLRENIVSFNIRLKSLILASNGVLATEIDPFYFDKPSVDTKSIKNLYTNLDSVSTWLDDRYLAFQTAENNISAICDELDSTLTSTDFSVSTSKSDANTSSGTPDLRFSFNGRIRIIFCWWRSCPFWNVF